MPATPAPPAKTFHQNDLYQTSWSWCPEPEGEDTEEKVSREAEGSQKQHSCLSRMINCVDIVRTFKKRGKKMNSKEKEKDRVLTRKGGWSEPYNSSWWRRKLEV